MPAVCVAACPFVPLALPDDCSEHGRRGCRIMDVVLILATIEGSQPIGLDEPVADKEAGAILP